MSEYSAKSLGLSPGATLRGEFFAEFADLRLHHDLAIRLARVILEILPVVVLGGIESRGGAHLRHDGAVPQPGGFEPADHVPGNPLLFRRMVENNGPVLGAHVVSLAVAGGGI